VDVLPHVGDRGVVANDETRDSEWQPEFTATTLADLMAFVGGISGATLEFSTECEPCLSADLGAPVTDLASCATPNWSSTAPTNLTDICSFKIDFGSTFELTQDDSITLDFTMSAPAGVPTNGEIAWNSFGFVGNKENGSALLASEPIKVGIESLPSLEVCDIPLVAAYAIQASCTDGVPNNNGYLQLSTITDGDRFNWSVGSTYTGDADYANATDTTGFPIIIVDTLSNPSGSRDYTIRVFNGASNCFTDVVVTMNEQDCTIGCDCKEFLYMNDPSSGTVHKFEIHADGSTTEINPTGPWYPNGGVSGLPSPHGLGSDLNGNLYIGEGIGINMGDEGDLRRLDCDGNLYPVSNFIIENVYPRNVFSIGNYLFSNKRPSGSSGATSSDYMLVYDLCTETLVDSICFDNPTSTADASLGWGFYIYDDIVYAVTDQHELYAFDPFNYLETSTCVTPFAENVNTYSDAGNNKFGVASDGTHVYVVYAATYNGPAQVLMFDLNGNFITKTAVDNIDGDGGWYGAAAIVYSETCNCIITTSASPNEDCAYAFELDLTPMGPSVVPADIEANAGEPFEAKASAILKECCPTNNNITIDTTLCGTMIDDQIFLQELISCDGIICEGNWQAGGSNTGMTYNTCDNSITITSLMACGSFTLESDGVGNALQCGAFKITVNIEVINHPSVTLLPDSTICIGENILLYGILDTVGMPTYQWQQSTTSCTTGFANITSATDSTYLATPSDTTYFRLITSSSGACASGNCTDTSACVTIYPTELPMATVADVLKCTENSETISVSPSGGIGPYTYSWSGPSIISGQGTDEITASSPGTYTVTVMDAEGCTKTTSGEMTFQSKVCLPATFSIKRGN